MQNQEKNTQVLTIDQAIAPIVQLGINFREQRKLFHQMFTISVANAPDDELDNWTAKQLSPFYLAMCELLENLDDVDDVHADNILSCMSTIKKK